MSCDEQLVGRTRSLSFRDSNNLVLETRHIAQSRSSLVIGPKIFAIRIEYYSPYWLRRTTSLRHSGITLVEIREHQFNEVGPSETRAREHECAWRYATRDFDSSTHVG